MDPQQQEQLQQQQQQHGVMFPFVPVLHHSTQPMEFELQMVQPAVVLTEEPPSFYMLDPVVYYRQELSYEPYKVVEDSDNESSDSSLLMNERETKTENQNGLSMGAYLRTFVLVAILAAYITIFTLLATLPGTWSSWKPASCLPDNCFCEEPREDLLRQPTNSWTNIAFTLYGLYILYKVWAVPSSQYNGVPSFYAIVYALALVFIGFTSGWYHASLTFVGQWFDVMGMFFLVNWCFTYNFARCNIWGKGGFLIAYLGLNVIAGVVQYIWVEDRRYCFAAMIVVYLLSTVIANRKLHPNIQTRYLLIAITCFAVAFTFWVLDIKHILCWPTSWFQGHGVWHVLTATSAYNVYVYYTTEIHSSPPSPSASEETFEV